MPFVDPCPECESPIEERFAWGITKRIDASTLVKTQVPVSTIGGNFRIDFVLVGKNGRRVAYECDGAEFHDASRDEWRDAMILGSAHVDAIVRLTGADINFRLDDALYVASQWDPVLFSKRGHINLKRLASKRALEFDAEHNPGLAVVYYRGDEAESPGPMYLRLRRTTRIAADGKQASWQEAFNFAKTHGSGNLDKIIEAYRQSLRPDV